MSDTDDDKSDANRNNESKVLAKIFFIGVFFLIVTLLVSSVIFYYEVTRFSSSIYDLSRLGSWGDFFGGFLNPIFSFLALIGLIYTIKYQVDELKLTRDQLEGSRKASEKLVTAAQAQNIENAFFQILSLMQSNLQSIKAKDGVTSENAFRQIYNEFMYELATKLKPSSGEALSINRQLDVLDSVFSKKYREHDAKFGRYFRILSNMLHFLSDKKSVTDPSIHSLYASLVRATLSDYELLMISYYCLTNQGKKIMPDATDISLLFELNYKNL